MRSFIEYESGAHTIQPVGPNKPNATIAKLKLRRLHHRPREGRAASSWYAEKYRDGLKPELVLVEPSDRRVDHVQQVVSLWAKERYLGKEPFKVRVLTRRRRWPATSRTSTSPLHRDRETRPSASVRLRLSRSTWR